MIDYARASCKLLSHCVSKEGFDILEKVLFFLSNCMKLFTEKVFGVLNRHDNNLVSFSEIYMFFIYIPITLYIA